MTDAPDSNHTAAVASQAAVNTWRRAAVKVRAHAVDLAGWSTTELTRSDFSGVDAPGDRALSMLSRSLRLLIHVLDRSITAPPIDDGSWSTQVGTPLGDILNGSISVQNFLRGGHMLLDDPTIRILYSLEGVKEITTWLIQGRLIPWAWPDIDDEQSSMERNDAWRTAKDLEQDRMMMADGEAARRYEREAEASAAAIAKVEQDVRTSAGVVAEGTTARAFADYADKQATAARHWLIATGLLLTSVVGVGLWLLWGDRAQDWQDVVAHVVVGAPLAGLAAYTARESSRRRESAERGRHVATQLKTVDAYCAQLPDDASRDLLTHFGRYLYGAYTLPGDNPLHSIPPELLDAVLNAVKK